MPLRFDEPELLGKWEGDSAPLHQAIAKIGKGESVLERGLEKQNPKTPSYKIDPVKGSPFKKDNDKVGMLVDQAIDAVNRGENPEPFTAKASQITNTGLAQKNALDQIKLQVNELQQTYPDGVVNPIPVNDNINSAYNDHDETTRDQAISEAAKQLKDPSLGMFNGEKFYANKFLKLAPVTVDYTEKDEFGNVNVGTERKVSGRLLVPDIKRPQFEGKNGKKVPAVDGNGQPVYQLRQAETIDDVIPLVQAAFGEDPNAAQWRVNQVSREDKKTIDDITNEWISSERNRPDGGIPDKETIEAKRQIIARDLAEKKIAKQWLQSERPTTVLNNTRTVDEPTEADKDRAFSSSWGANGSYSTTFTSADKSGNRDAVFFFNGDKKEGEIKTYGELGIARRDKNNEPKPIIVRTDEGAWNASRGEHIKQGLEMNVGGIVLMAIYKKTGMPKPTNKSADQLKKEGYKFAPFIEGKMLLGKENKAIKKEDVADYEQYVTLNNKPYLSTNNNGVNEQEEFNKLEAKFTKQGQSSYVMKKLDNKITNQLAKKDIDGFFNLNDENRKIKKQLDELNTPTGTNAVGLTKGGEVEANKKAVSKMTIPPEFDEIVEVNGKKYFVTKDRKKHQLIQ